MEKKIKIHLIGIGGIGVSALAQYYLSKGHTVSGSDLVASEITDFLKEKGAAIFIGNTAGNISDNLDLVIFSPAVKEENQELAKARALQAFGQKLQVLSYPEALGELTKKYFTIAISGSHGKSTTTAMIGLILAKAGLDPMVIVGTKVKEFGNKNIRIGEGEIMLVRTCQPVGISGSRQGSGAVRQACQGLGGLFFGATIDSGRSHTGNFFRRIRLAACNGHNHESG